MLGVHVHVGSQLEDFDAQAETIVRLAAFAAACRDELGWVARVADLGGGFGIRHHPSDTGPERGRARRERCRDGADAPSSRQGLPAPEVWLEPGRCLVGRAGVTLYRVGSVKRLPGRTWVAIDGGMSDNPRPQLYDARYTALSATRADEHVDELVSVAGMHCESGDVLIDDVALPSPRRGDLLAVPATGAYTLAMASNYNGVTRPAAVLVRDGDGARDPPARDSSTTSCATRSRDRAAGRGRARPGLPRRGRRAADRARRARRRRRSARRPARASRRQAGAGRRRPAARRRSARPRRRSGSRRTPSRSSPRCRPSRRGARAGASIPSSPASRPTRPGASRRRRSSGSSRPRRRALADPEARATLPFTSLRFPEPLYVDGIDVEGHVLWGMTLRLLDDLLPRLLAG